MRGATPARGPCVSLFSGLQEAFDLALSQTVITKSKRLPENVSTLFDDCPEISMFSSSIAFTASRFSPDGWVPALKALNRSLPMLLKKPSAI